MTDKPPLDPIKELFPGPESASTTAATSSAATSSAATSSAATSSAASASAASTPVASSLVSSPGSGRVSVTGSGRAPGAATTTTSTTTGSSSAAAAAAAAVPDPLSDLAASGRLVPGMKRPGVQVTAPAEPQIASSGRVVASSGRVVGGVSPVGRKPLPGPAIASSGRIVGNTATAATPEEDTSTDSSESTVTEEEVLVEEPATMAPKHGKHNHGAGHWRNDIMYGHWRTFKKGTTRRFELHPEHDPNYEKYPNGRTWIYENYTLSDRADSLAGPGPRPPRKYYLSIIAMFKNEAHVMQEWLEHHIGHGVDHFYLINDHSEDNVEAITSQYASFITNIRPPNKNNQFRQTGVYKSVMTKILARNESQWVAIIDLDEFLYSPQERDVKNILKQHESLGVIGLNWVWFGSSGNVEQPASVIQGFTKRADYDATKYPKLLEHYTVMAPARKKVFDSKEWQKNIINTKFRVDNIEVHYANVEGTSQGLSYMNYPDDPPLLLNHYSIQSKNFFLNEKAKRGSANGYYKV